jgi:hypothetical protein
MNIKAQATSSTSILVEWQVPVYPNGIIANYFIYYGSHKDNLERVEQVTGKTLSKSITGLRTFTSYYVQVRGKTTKNGNASVIVKVKTFEDGKSMRDDLDL